MKLITSAVIVTYNPDIDRLLLLLESICFQVDYIFIIDNSTKNLILKRGNFANLKIVNNGKNLGIAEAQNIGIKLSQKHNSDFILTSDQDTIFPKNYVNKMLEIFSQQQQKVVCIAPYFRDANRENMIEKSVSFNKRGIIKQNKEIKTTTVSHVISSGMFFRTDAFKIIGLFDESLFIDYVDHDWCFRCHMKEKQILQTSDLIIEHKIGNKPRRVFSRKVITPSGKRIYFYLRNLFFITFFKEYSPQIKRYLLKRYFIQLVKFLLLEPGTTLKYFFKSISDSKKMGMKDT
jgi:rhamnosyltransferase